MADFDDFSIANRPRPAHGHPKKKRFLGLDILEHLSVDHPQSFNQHSVASKSPQSSRESPANHSPEGSTLPSSYSLLEPKDLPHHGVDDFVVGMNAALPDLNVPTQAATRDLMATRPLPPFAKTMAPHARQKLKRGPREHDMQVGTIPLLPDQILTSRSSLTNENTMSSNITRPRPKLKRQPPEYVLQETSNPSKSPLQQYLASPTSPTNDNTNQLDLTSPNNSRDKSPADNHISNPSSSLAFIEAAGEKSPPNEDRASPDPNCAICLGKLRNKSFTDSCLHQFCFKCLVQWSKVKPECPLCKQGFKSIIHNVRSNEDYDQYHCRPAPPPTRCRESSLINELLEFNPGLSRFRYRTTMTDQRMSFSANIQDLFHHSYIIPSAHRWPSRLHRRQLASSEFRSSIYSRDLWVEDLPDITGRLRDATPDFYSANQAQLHRLVPWLNREIPCVLITHQVPPAVIIDIILSLIVRYPITSPMVIGQLRSYFGVRTNHFLHEFYAFARSPFDLIGFDQTATYGPNPNPTIYTADIDDSDTSSGTDSDVICLESELAPVAGPSGLNRSAFISVITSHSTSSDVGASGTTVQSTETVVDDSDDCEIVDYVKPRHERTPEIVVLSDTDEDATKYEPSTSGVPNRVAELFDAFEHTLSDLVFSPQPPSLPSTPPTLPSSDSEYVPYSRKRRKDKVAKVKCRRGSSNSRSKSKLCRKVASKSHALSDTSDSDEDLNSRAKKRKLRMKGRSKKRCRFFSSVSPQSPPEGQDSRTNLPGFLPRQFGSDDSLEGHSSVIIPFLEHRVNSIFTSTYLPAPNLREPTSDLNRSPVASTSQLRQSSSPSNSDTLHLGRDCSPTPFDEGKRAHPRPKSSTWCIKPSNSDITELSDEHTTTPTSSPENPPRLKSIVIMRNPDDRDSFIRHAPASQDLPGRRRLSQSPVASTSRSSLWSPSETSYDPRLYHSSSVEEQSSSPRGKASKRKCKSKCSKKDSKRKTSKRSDSNSSKSKSKKCKAPSWYRPRESDSPSSS